MTGDKGHTLLYYSLKNPSKIDGAIHKMSRMCICNYPRRQAFKDFEAHARLLSCDTGIILNSYKNDKLYMTYMGFIALNIS